MSFVPCYFCPAGRKRSDKLRDHCRRLHATAASIPIGTKNKLGYVFHCLDGYTDRVWATSRGGESPSSVGHCFKCATTEELPCPNTSEKKGVTIEEFMRGHICNEQVGKERAKRPEREGAHLKAHLTAVGGAGAVTHSGPSVTVDEDFLLCKYKELGKTIEYLYDDDCNLRVKDSVELVFAKAFKAEAILEKNKELAAQLASVASVTPVASTMDAGMVLLMLKSDSKLTRFIDEQDALKRQQAMNPLKFGEDEEDEVVVYTPLEVLRQIALIAKQANHIRGQSDSFKEQARKKIDDLERALSEATNKITELEKELGLYEKDLHQTNDLLRLHRDAVKRLTEKLSQTAPVSVPPADEAPLSGCKSE